MDMITVSAKTVDEAVTKALIELKTTSDKLEYEVVEEGSKGFLGLGAKPAVIRAKKKETVADRAIEFLTQIFDAMGMDVSIKSEYNEGEQELSLELEGGDMGILIGKRGQTLSYIVAKKLIVVFKIAELFTVVIYYLCKSIFEACFMSTAVRSMDIISK